MYACELTLVLFLGCRGVSVSWSKGKEIMLPYSNASSRSTNAILICRPSTLIGRLVPRGSIPRMLNSLLVQQRRRAEMRMRTRMKVKMKARARIPLMMLDFVISFAVLFMYM